MQKKFKKMLAVILSLVMIMTMLPMTVIPSSAAEYLDHNIKVEVVDWVVRDVGQIVGEFNAVEHGDAFYYESLTEAADGTFIFSYTLALERNGGNTAWDENSISFKIDSCEEEFLQEFEKSFVSSYYIEYNIKVSRRAGHSFSDWADVGDGTHTRICSFCGTVETKAHSFSGANCTTKGKCACGLESTKDSNTHTKPVKYVVNSENEFKHDEVYECCGVVNSNLDHKYDSNGMCKECKYQCEHTAYTNGICDVCRYKCSHTAIVDGECTLCGKVGIPYINRYWDEETKSVVEVTEIAPVETIEIDGSFSTLQNECWYVVRGNISRSSLTVSGTAHLILADGATLNLSSGLRVNEGNTLYIYAQSSSDNCGKLVSVATDDNAGIGGSGYGTNCGTIVINGGNIQAQAKGRGTGIGGGYNANGGNITINGGIVTATPSSSYNAAIGGSSSGLGGNITINGGTVIANGRIGSCSGNSGNITINGGNVTSSGSIGGKKVNSIVINGGVISVISTSKDNAAIGGGEQGKGGSININGGVITATGGEFSSAIGGGYSGYVDSITITGGTVIATGSNQNAASVGSSNDSKNCAVVLSGGNIKASQVRGVSVTDGNGNDVALNTITLSGASADTAVTKVEGIAYGLDDVKTLDTDKLYFYLPADSALSAITAGENEYICNRNLTYHTSHDWSDANGICTGCGDKCDHAEQTGEICEICGGLTHIHSFTYTANGNVITATCSNEDGKCPDTNGGTLTIFAPAEPYTDGTISREAVIDNQFVESADYTVTYSTADGTAPKNAGTYTASVTVGGATATVEFTLSNYVASVTDKDGNLIDSFKNLDDAVTAAQASENSTITLLDDVTVNKSIEISSGKFTLDLNGNTITTSAGDGINVSGSNTVLTIDDSGENGKIECTSTEVFSSVIDIFNATVNINDGIISYTADEFLAYSIYVNGDGILNVYGGKIISLNGNAISNYNITNIYSGEIVSSYGRAISNNYITNIYGGTIKTFVNDNIINRDTLNIYGGRFELEDDWYYIIYNYEGTVSLSGGEFIQGLRVYDYEKVLNLVDILADGYFCRDTNGKLIKVAEDATEIEGYVKISKGADLADAVITLDNTEFTYTGEEIIPTVVVKVGGKTLAEGTDYTLTFANNINAGTATVTAKAVGQTAGGIAGGANSNVGNSVESIYTGEITKEFTILKADSAVETEPTANELTYNGEAQALVTAGSSENGAVVYSLDSAEYSETIPTAINAGEYTVYYKVIGDVNHNDSEPETVTVTIGKKPVTVSATVPDRIYGDDYRVDTSKVVVTFDGIVDGDDVGYVVIDAYYHMHSVTDSAPVQVVYNVNGADAGNYQFPEYGDWLAPNYPVQATGKVLPRDIADAEIVLGDALIYNGEEQTQSITSVTVIGKEVTYDVNGNKATNVGVYELTITGNGNFTGTKTVLFEVAPDTSAIDALTVDNVKSTDEEAIEAAAQQIENAVTDLADDAKKAEYKAITDKCDELLDKIAETEEKLEEIKGIENNFNPENITSDDKAAIEEKVAEIENVNPDNLTPEQKAEYDEIKAGFDALLEEIEAAGAEVDAIRVELEMFDENRVTIFREDEIEALKAKIDELLADENMGEAEKAKLNEYKAQADNLIEIINTPAKYFSMRLFYFVWDALNWLVNHVVFICNWVLGLFN